MYTLCNNYTISELDWIRPYWENEAGSLTFSTYLWHLYHVKVLKETDWTLRCAQFHGLHPEQRFKQKLSQAEWRQTTALISAPKKTYPCWFYVEFRNKVLRVKVSRTGCATYGRVYQMLWHFSPPLWCISSSDPGTRTSCAEHQPGHGVGLMSYGTWEELWASDPASHCSQNEFS